MIFDIAGVAILIFLLCFFCIALYLLIRTPSRIAPIIVIFSAIVFLGLYTFMVSSTLARRAYINIDVRALATSFFTHATAIAIAGLLAFAIYRVAKRIAGENDLQLGLLVAGAMLIVIVPTLIWLYRSTFEPDLDQVFVGAAPAAAITVEGDLPVQIFENQVVKSPTALELGPENELYVASNQGFIWVIMDDNLDGVPDNILEFASGLAEPQGLAWSEEGIFVNVEGQLLLLKDTDDDWIADEEILIVDNLPREIYAFHRNHGITFGPGGRLYIGVGATSDYEEERHPLGARILSLNPDGSDLRVYATGTRNPYGIIPTADGEGLLAVDNGSSGCTDKSCVTRVDVPEEVNYIREGKDYGFPKYFGVPEQGANSMPPIVTLPEHTAPTGIVLYEGDALPEQYKGQLFVSLWNASEIYRIRLFKIDEDHYTGSPKLFASGILGPSAMINSPYGGIYVASFSGNAIYHIGNY